MNSPMHVEDVSVADWISPHLGTFGTVGGLVPLGFERYVQVASADRKRPGMDEGLSTETVVGLSEAVASRGSETSCYFGIWEGHGWVNGGGQVSIATAGGRPVPHEALDRLQAAADATAFPVDVLKGPKLKLPYRTYLLFSGPLGTALQLGREEFGRFEAYAPDLIWPDTREWFVATDTDLNFAYVGASKWLLDVVADNSRLIAVAVTSEDWLGEIEPRS
jgi:hypothetical protein